MLKSDTKKSIVIISMMLLLVIAASCGSTNPSETTTQITTQTTTETTTQTTTQETTSASAADAEEKVFNREELAKYNGQDGQPAYVAVDGVVYDVTNYPLWKDGKHNGNTAGVDLTSVIKEKSPHGTAIFEKKSVPVVGKYQE